MQNLYLIFLLRHLKSLLWFTLLGALLAFSLSILQEKEYEASGRLIIVSHNLNLDAYSAAKASQLLGGILIEKIYSNDFITDVLKADSTIIDNFGSTAAQRLKNWKKKVSAKIKSSSGVLELSVFHSEKNQAQKIANAIFELTILNAQKYIGGQGVDIQIIDSPSVSLRPVRPSISFNTFIGALIGFFGIFSIIYLFSNDLENIQAEIAMKKKGAYPPPDLPIA